MSSYSLSRLSSDRYQEAIKERGTPNWVCNAESHSRLPWSGKASLRCTSGILYFFVAYYDYAIVIFALVLSYQQNHHPRAELVKACSDPPNSFSRIAGNHGQPSIQYVIYLCRGGARTSKRYE